MGKPIAFLDPVLFYGSITDITYGLLLRDWEFVGLG
jgi:hypothetical protein